jgi:sRNA-binding carbon storage regulator CsrA
MGKLVLTRRAGESVIVREANGDEWVLTVHPHHLRFNPSRVYLDILNLSGEEIAKTLRTNESISFAGGSVELRPARCPSQAILAFDFPRDVTILRTEIA